VDRFNRLLVVSLAAMFALTATAQSCPPNPPPTTCRCEFDLILGSRFQAPSALPILPPDASTLLVNLTFPADAISAGSEFMQPRGTFSGPANSVDRWVIGESLPLTRLTLGKVFNDMKSRLVANSISTALNTVYPDLRPQLQTFWTGLSAQPLFAVSRLGFVLDGELSNTQAQLRIARTQATSNVWNVYPLAFARDKDGVWRIREM